MSLNVPGTGSDELSRNASFMSARNDDSLALVAAIAQVRASGNGANRGAASGGLTAAVPRIARRARTTAAKARPSFIAFARSDLGAAATPAGAATATVGRPSFSSVPQSGRVSFSRGVASADPSAAPLDEEFDRALLAADARRALKERDASWFTLVLRDAADRRDRVLRSRLNPAATEPLQSGHVKALGNALNRAVQHGPGYISRFNAAALAEGRRATVAAALRAEGGGSNEDTSAGSMTMTGSISAGAGTRTGHDVSEADALDDGRVSAASQGLSTTPSHSAQALSMPITTLNGFQQQSPRPHSSHGETSSRGDTYSSRARSRSATSLQGYHVEAPDEATVRRMDKQRRLLFARGPAPLGPRFFPLSWHRNVTRDDVRAAVAAQADRTFATRDGGLQWYRYASSTRHAGGAVPVAQRMRDVEAVMADASFFGTSAHQAAARHNRRTRALRADATRYAKSEFTAAGGNTFGFSAVNRAQSALERRSRAFSERLYSHVVAKVQSKRRDATRADSYREFEIALHVPTGADAHAVQAPRLSVMRAASPASRSSSGAAGSGQRSSVVTSSGARGSRRLTAGAASGSDGGPLVCSSVGAARTVPFLFAGKIISASPGLRAWLKGLRAAAKAQAQAAGPIALFGTWGTDPPTSVALASSIEEGVISLGAFANSVRVGMLAVPAQLAAENLGALAPADAQQRGFPLGGTVALLAGAGASIAPGFDLGSTTRHFATGTLRPSSAVPSSGSRPVTNAAGRLGGSIAQQSAAGQSRGLKPAVGVAAAPLPVFPHMPNEFHDELLHRRFRALFAIFGGRRGAARAALAAAGDRHMRRRVVVDIPIPIPDPTLEAAAVSDFPATGAPAQDATQAQPGEVVDLETTAQVRFRRAMRRLSMTVAEASIVPRRMRAAGQLPLHLDLFKSFVTLRVALAGAARHEASLFRPDPAHGDFDAVSWGEKSPAVVLTVRVHVLDTLRQVRQKIVAAAAGRGAVGILGDPDGWAFDFPCPAVKMLRDLLFALNHFYSDTEHTLHEGHRARDIKTSMREHRSLAQLLIPRVMEFQRAVEHMTPLVSILPQFQVPLASRGPPLHGFYYPDEPFALPVVPPKVGNARFRPNCTVPINRALRDVITLLRPVRPALMAQLDRMAEGRAQGTGMAKPPTDVPLPAPYAGERAARKRLVEAVRSLQWQRVKQTHDAFVACVHYLESGLEMISTATGQQPPNAMSEADRDSVLRLARKQQQTIVLPRIVVRTRDASESINTVRSDNERMAQQLALTAEIALHDVLSTCDRAIEQLRARVITAHFAADHARAQRRTASHVVGFLNPRSGPSMPGMTPRGAGAGDASLSAVSVSNSSRASVAASTPQLVLSTPPPVNANDLIDRLLLSIHEVARAGKVPFLDARDHVSGTTLLHRVAQFPLPGVAAVLVSLGADVIAQDDRGYTPLHYIVDRGDVTDARDFLAAVADPEKTLRHHLSRGSSVFASSTAFLVSHYRKKHQQGQQQQSSTGGLTADDAAPRASQGDGHGSKPAAHEQPGGSGHGTMLTGTTPHQPLQLTCRALLRVLSRTGESPLTLAMRRRHRDVVIMLLSQEHDLGPLTDAEQLILHDAFPLDACLADGETALLPHLVRHGGADPTIRLSGAGGLSLFASTFASFRQQRYQLQHHQRAANARMRTFSGRHPALNRRASAFEIEYTNIAMAAAAAARRSGVAPVTDGLAANSALVGSTTDSAPSSAPTSARAGGRHSRRCPAETSVRWLLDNAGEVLRELRGLWQPAAVRQYVAPALAVAASPGSLATTHASFRAFHESTMPPSALHLVATHEDFVPALSLLLQRGLLREHDMSNAGSLAETAAAEGGVTMASLAPATAAASLGPLQSLAAAKSPASPAASPGRVGRSEATASRLVVASPDDPVTSLRRIRRFVSVEDEALLRAATTAILASATVRATIDGVRRSVLGAALSALPATPSGFQAMTSVANALIGLLDPVRVAIARCSRPAGEAESRGAESAADAEQAHSTFFASVQARHCAVLSRAALTHTDATGCTTLHTALARRCVPVAQLLMRSIGRLSSADARVIMESRNSDGDTPLAVAVRSDFAEGVRMFAPLAALALQTRVSCDRCVLLLAVHVRAAKFHMERANPHTPALAPEAAAKADAVERPNSEFRLKKDVLHALFDIVPPDYPLRDLHGPSGTAQETPVLAAVKAGPRMWHTVSQLLMHGADATIPDASGATCMGLAAADQGDVSLTQLLLANDATDPLQPTTLLAVLRAGGAAARSLRLITGILDRAPINLRDTHRGAEFLIAAARAGSVHILIELIRRGARCEQAAIDAALGSCNPITELLQYYQRRQVQSFGVRRKSPTSAVAVVDAGWLHANHFSPAEVVACVDQLLMVDVPLPNVVLLLAASTCDFALNQSVTPQGSSVGVATPWVTAAIRWRKSAFGVAATLSQWVSDGSIDMRTLVHAVEQRDLPLVRWLCSLPGAASAVYAALSQPRSRRSILQRAVCRTNVRCVLALAQCAHTSAAARVVQHDGVTSPTDADAKKRTSLAEFVAHCCNSHSRAPRDDIVVRWILTTIERDTCAVLADITMLLTHPEMPQTGRALALADPLAVSSPTATALSGLILPSHDQLLFKQELRWGSGDAVKRVAEAPFFQIDNAPTAKTGAAIATQGALALRHVMFNPLTRLAFTQATVDTGLGGKMPLAWALQGLLAAAASITREASVDGFVDLVTTWLGVGGRVNDGTTLAGVNGSALDIVVAPFVATRSQVPVEAAAAGQLERLQGLGLWWTARAADRNEVVGAVSYAAKLHQHFARALPPRWICIDPITAPDGAGGEPSRPGRDADHKARAEIRAPLLQDILFPAVALIALRESSDEVVAGRTIDRLEAVGVNFGAALDTVRSPFASLFNADAPIPTSALEAMLMADGWRCEFVPVVDRIMHRLLKTARLAWTRADIDRVVTPRLLELCLLRQLPSSSALLVRQADLRPRVLNEHYTLRSRALPWTSLLSLLVSAKRRPDIVLGGTSTEGPSSLLRKFTGISGPADANDSVGHQPAPHHSKTNAPTRWRCDGEGESSFLVAAADVSSALRAMEDHAVAWRDANTWWVDALFGMAMTARILDQRRPLLPTEEPVNGASGNNTRVKSAGHKVRLPTAASRGDLPSDSLLAATNASITASNKFDSASGVSGGKPKPLPTWGPLTRRRAPALAKASHPYLTLLREGYTSSVSTAVPSVPLTQSQTSAAAERRCRTTATSPLHLAVRLNRLNVFIAMLVSSGTAGARGTSSSAVAVGAAQLDLNATDWHGRTPLAIAASVNSGAMVSALLRYGADPLIADRRGWTALHYACRVSRPFTASQLEQFELVSQETLERMVRPAGVLGRRRHHRALEAAASLTGDMTSSVFDDGHGAEFLDSTSGSPQRRANTSTNDVRPPTAGSANPADPLATATPRSAQATPQTTSMQGSAANAVALARTPSWMAEGGRLTQQAGAGGAAGGEGLVPGGGRRAQPTHCVWLLLADTSGAEAWLADAGVAASRAAALQRRSTMATGTMSANTSQVVSTSRASISPALAIEASGVLPIVFALRAAHDDLALFMLAHDMAPPLKRRQVIVGGSRETLLHIAARTGCIKTLRWLVANSDALYAGRRTAWGATAADLAINAECEEILQNVPVCGLHDSIAEVEGHDPRIRAADALQLARTGGAVAALMGSQSPHSTSVWAGTNDVAGGPLITGPAPLVENALTLRQSNLINFYRYIQLRVRDLAVWHSSAVTKLLLSGRPAPMGSGGGAHYGGRSEITKKDPLNLGATSAELRADFYFNTNGRWRESPSFGGVESAMLPQLSPTPLIVSEALRVSTLEPLAPQNYPFQTIDEAAWEFAVCGNDAPLYELLRLGVHDQRSIVLTRLPRIQSNARAVASLGHEIAAAMHRFGGADGGVKFSGRPNTNEFRATLLLADAQAVPRLLFESELYILKQRVHVALDMPRGPTYRIRPAVPSHVVYSPNGSFWAYETIVHHLVRTGCSQAFTCVLESNAIPGGGGLTQTAHDLLGNQYDRNGLTVYHHAVLAGRWEIVVDLLRYKVSQRPDAFLGLRPLDMLSSRAHAVLCQMAGPTVFEAPLARLVPYPRLLAAMHAGFAPAATSTASSPMAAPPARADGGVAQSLLDELIAFNREECVDGRLTMADDAPLAQPALMLCGRHEWHAKYARATLSAVLDDLPALLLRGVVSAYADVVNRRLQEATARENDNGSRLSGGMQRVSSSPAHTPRRGMHSVAADRTASQWDALLRTCGAPVIRRVAESLASLRIDVESSFGESNTAREDFKAAFRSMDGGAAVSVFSEVIRHFLTGCGVFGWVVLDRLLSLRIVCGEKSSVAGGRGVVIHSLDVRGGAGAPGLAFDHRAIELEAEVSVAATTRPSAHSLLALTVPVFVSRTIAGGCLIAPDAVRALRDSMCVDAVEAAVRLADSIERHAPRIAHRVRVMDRRFSSLFGVVRCLLRGRFFETHARQAPLAPTASLSASSREEDEVDFADVMLTQLQRALTPSDAEGSAVITRARFHAALTKDVQTLRDALATLAAALRYSDAARSNNASRRTSRKSSATAATTVTTGSVSMSERGSASAAPSIFSHSIPARSASKRSLMSPLSPLSTTPAAVSEEQFRCLEIAGATTAAPYLLPRATPIDVVFTEKGRLPPMLKPIAPRAALDAIALSGEVDGLQHLGLSLLLDNRRLVRGASCVYLVCPLASSRPAHLEAATSPATAVAGSGDFDSQRNSQDNAAASLSAPMPPLSPVGPNVSALATMALPQSLLSDADPGASFEMPTQADFAAAAHAAAAAFPPYWLPLKTSDCYLARLDGGENALRSWSDCSWQLPGIRTLPTVERDPPERAFTYEALLDTSALTLAVPTTSAAAAVTAGGPLAAHSTSSFAAGVDGGVNVVAKKNNSIREPFCRAVEARLDAVVSEQFAILAPREAMLRRGSLSVTPPDGAHATELTPFAAEPVDAYDALSQQEPLAFAVDTARGLMPTQHAASMSVAKLSVAVATLGQALHLHYGPARERAIRGAAFEDGGSVGVNYLATPSPAPGNWTRRGTVASATGSTGYDDVAAALMRRTSDALQHQQQQVRSARQQPLSGFKASAGACLALSALLTWTMDEREVCRAMRVSHRWWRAGLFDILPNAAAVKVSWALTAVPALEIRLAAWQAKVWGGGALPPAAAGPPAAASAATDGDASVPRDGQPTSDNPSADALPLPVILGRGSVAGDAPFVRHDTNRTAARHLSTASSLPRVASTVVGDDDTTASYNVVAPDADGAGLVKNNGEIAAEGGATQRTQLLWGVNPAAAKAVMARAGRLVPLGSVHAVATALGERNVDAVEAAVARFLRDPMSTLQQVCALYGLCGAVEVANLQLGGDHYPQPRRATFRTFLREYVHVAVCYQMVLQRSWLCLNKLEADFDQTPQV